MPSKSAVPTRPHIAIPPLTRDTARLQRRAAHPLVFLSVIFATQLMVVLDTSIVTVALPAMQRSLHFSGTTLSWVLNGYILTFGGLLLLGARAGDLLGRRRTLLLGITIFSLSSLVGGIAVTDWMLLAARAAQGIGAALAAPSALALLTSAFPEGPARYRAIGMFTTVSAAGAALGLVAGGLLTQMVSWRWVMFVNVPIGLGVWVLGRVVISESDRRSGRFDLFGAVSSTLGMSAVVFGLVQAASNGWNDPTTAGSLAAGLILLGIFVGNERRAPEPILPLHLLTNANRTTANVARGLVYAGMYGMFFFLSQFLQDVQHYSPMKAGVAFLPVPIAVFLSSQLTSRVLVHRFSAKAVMMGGIALAMVALVLTSQLTTDTTYPQIVVGLVLLGTGSGMSLVSLTTAALSGVSPAEAGAASGLVNVLQQLGAALGLAVLVNVFGSVTAHAQLSGTAPQATLVSGLDDVFGVGALFALVALVAVAALVRRPAPSSAMSPEPRTETASPGEPELAMDSDATEPLGVETMVPLELSSEDSCDTRPASAVRGPDCLEESA